MKFLPSLVSFFVLLALSPFVAAVPLGSSYTVSSSHGTSSDGIQGWSAISLQSPSGQLYIEPTHNGLDRPDGTATRSILLNEVGNWIVVYETGYSAPQSGTTVSTNLGSLTVESPPPANAPPTVSWTSAPVSANSGQAYTITAHGHDADGNLTRLPARRRRGSGNPARRPDRGRHPDRRQLAPDQT